MHPLDSDVQNIVWTAAITTLVLLLLWIFSRWEKRQQTPTERRKIVLTLLNQNEQRARDLRVIARKLGLSRAKALVLLCAMRNEGSVTIEKMRGVYTRRFRRICAITHEGQRELALITSRGSLETRQSS